MEVGLEEPKGLRNLGLEDEGRISYREQHTNRAAVTDSSHRSSRNSSRAMDSLSTLMIKWHS